MLTVSLELAKKMKELGRSKLTHFLYIQREESKAIMGLEDGFFIASADNLIKYEPILDRVHCATAQEILDELPCRIEKEGTRYLLEMFKDIPESGCVAGYNDDTDECPLIRSQRPEGNLAEALGQLWCWCREQKYV